MFARTCILRQHAAEARAVLGLHDGQPCTPADIKRAFRERALTAHPDAGGDPDRFRRLQSAYEALLREHGVGKHESEAGSGGSGGGGGFYAHPHAQWSNDARAHWHNMHAEANMNSNTRGSDQHASNTHYKARPHHRTYGEGLGDAFQGDFNRHRSSTASSSSSTWAGGAHGGSRANFSTWYFYRPYESDYRNPYGTGFTAEEIQQAAREQRWDFARTVARHACMWSAMAFVVYMHERNNRVRRAVEARNKGYQDPEYWAQLRQEEQEARRTNRAPLRLEHHWLDAPLVKPVMVDLAEADSRSGNTDSRGADVGAVSDTAKARAAQARQRQAVRPTRGLLRGGGDGAVGPRVVSYQGRPFTPNGVRGLRNTAPKTTQTYLDDVTYEMEDWEDDTI
ncbi:DnaJ domain containing protein [Novymonas esmeraldas]|uniref:DnaJ domain containing protein n=1 Tax=Novymonas esmeraldas TaxID=1808958 RepID=A0AAW0F262_9TRYP